MKKKLSAIIASVMLLSMSVTAFADSVQPRTPACMDCGGDTYNVSEEEDYPLAPQICSVCGDKTSAGTLKRIGYACVDYGHFMGTSKFTCFKCQ